MEERYWCAHCFRFCGVTEEADIFICCSDCGKVLADRISLQLVMAGERKRKKKAGKSNKVPSSADVDGGQIRDAAMVMTGAG